MFNKFKQKIADGVEGVSAGRQTPLSSRKHDITNEGSLQPQNNTSRVEKNEDSDSSSAGNSSFTHPLDENCPTPTESAQEDESFSASSLARYKSYNSGSERRKLSNSSTRSSSSVQDERGYTDSDAEAMSFSEMRELYKKQDRSLKRYKQKFSELVDAYKGLQKDKEKLEGTLTNGQDKQLRKIKELRETIELEQESKRHLEEALRIEMGEKDDQIDVLKTQVSLLKSNHGFSTSAHGGIPGSEVNPDVVQNLQDKVKLLTAEIETLTRDNEQAHAVVQRSEQEKKTAIEGVMNNMHELLNEQEDLRSQVNILRDELKDRDVTIMNIRSDEAANVDQLRAELIEELQETLTAQALKQQQRELEIVFEKKEVEIKSMFADKVQELQRVMEENEEEKVHVLHEKDTAITKKEDQILIMEEQLNELKDAEGKLQTTLQKLTSEKEVCDVRLAKCQQQLDEEKGKRVELVTQHEKEKQEKQSEWNDQLAKIKRTSQSKVYDAQDQLRKKTNELNDAIEKHKIELDTKLKESSQVLQAEHGKASRKLDAKVSDMKKVIKELRQKLAEKEGECNELESHLQDAKTEVDQAKSINTSLAVSEERVGQLSCNMEAMLAEVEEWKNKYEMLDGNYNELSTENKGLQDHLKEKDLCIKELVNKLNSAASSDEKFLSVCNELEEEKKKCLQLVAERDGMRGEVEHMTSTAKEEEKALQSELNNLKSKLSDVEDELQELTQQLHNKVSEIELLVATLDKVNKKLASKENMLEEKCKSLDELGETYNALLEEKQQLEYKHNEVVFELEESKNSSQSKVEEYELKLQVMNEEKTAFIQKLEANLCSKDDSNKTVEELKKTENVLKLHVDELTSKHKQDVEKYEKAINEYKLQIETIERRKCDDFNELTLKHTEDRNILLKQIEEKDSNLNELKMLLQQKDKEYAQIVEKVDEEGKRYVDLQAKLSEQEIMWKDKQQNLERKFKKVITDRDKKNKALLEEKQVKHDEEITSLKDSISSKENEFVSQLTESVNQINTLKQKVEEGSMNLKDASEKHASELNRFKLCENDAWSQLEQCKAEFEVSRGDYENRLSACQSKALEDKSVIETLNLKIMSCESSSMEIDAKISELLTEKSKLEEELLQNEKTYEDKIRLLNSENIALKDSYAENIRKLEGDVMEKSRLFEEQRCELLSKQSEAEEGNTSKLAELKEEAEMKISKLKKENSENVNSLELVKKELEEKITVLEAHVEEQERLHEEHVFNAKEHAKNLSDNLQEAQTTMKSISEKLNGEMSCVKEELSVKCEKVRELEELLDNATVDKMDALKLQKTHLDEEHEVEMKKITEDCKKQTDATEKKLVAKIEEKDFQHNSELKAMLKQFQSQLGTKDFEIQQAIQEATETAQRDERELMRDYDQQIIELQKELRLREQDMLALQDETQQQFDLLHEEREVSDREHREEHDKLQADYHQRLEDLSKRHEEALQNIASNKNTCIEEEQVKLDELEQKHALKVQQLEENHSSELAAQEKKYKIQLKQAKVEVRKLLASKGVNIPNVTEPDLSNVNASDNEMDQLEVVNSELSPSISKTNNRPATLQLSDSDVLSPPKSPQPLEFEYLRNILYNYMMGKQRKQMAKVLTAICHFTPSQVQQVLANVDLQESQLEKKSGFWP